MKKELIYCFEQRKKYPHLTPEEADVYYNSEHYLNLMKTKRLELIELGHIKNPKWHINTQSYDRPKPRLITPNTVVIKPVVKLC